MKSFITGALLLLTANFLSAQTPIMEISNNGNFKESGEVELQTLKADVKIYGNISTTKILMTFFNKTGRIQEGRLTFPLPEGVSVTVFALDINGAMRQAVPIEKATATAVFESIERRKVDPGILEKTEGNNFRTRVYPLPVNGARTIEISYNQTLNKIDQNLYYFLPLAKKSIKNFTLTTTVFDNINMPSLIEKPDGSFVFEKKGNAWTASINKTNFTPEQALKIQLPQSDNTEAIIKKRQEGGYYFLTSVNIKAPASKLLKPSHVTIIWDNSLSGLKRDHEAEKQFVKTFAEKNQNVTVQLCLLSNKYSCVDDFIIKNGDASDLLKSIDEIVYDGGTDYSLLTNLKYYNSTYLFFTDGLSNFGEAGSLPSRPVHTIVATPVANFSKLKSISSATGGQFINLNQQSPGKAVEQITTLPYRFLGIEQNALAKEVYPVKTVVSNENIVVTGILEKLTPEIALLFGFDNSGDKKIVVKIDPKNETSDWAIEKFWAQQKIEALEIFYEENKQAVATLGKEFGIVTKNTSLIVLENVEDYVKYRIVPPRDLLVEYNRIMKERQQEQQVAWNDLLEQSKATMNDLKEWWNTDFSKIKYKKKIPVMYEDRADIAVAAPPPPSPRNAPVADAAEAKMSSSDMIMESPAATDAGRGIRDAESAKLEEVVIIGNRAPRGKIITVDIKTDAAYIKEIETAASSNDAYKLYLELRNTYQQTPAFYFDVANWFFSKNEKEIAVGILSNLAELELEDAELYKTMCYMLKKFEQNDKQLLLAKKVLNWRPMDPQSYRDYALALQDNGLYQNALDTLYAALTQQYTDETLMRDQGIEEVLLMEINNLITLHKNKLDISKIDKQLISNLPVDIRVALNWNMDNVDIDLHVTDPSGEECYYSNNRTANGGRISNDFTDGFGPEQFLLKKAKKGTYKIHTNFFGEQRVTASGPSSLMAEVFLSYATGRQERKIVVFQSSGEVKETTDGKVYIGEFEF